MTYNIVGAGLAGSFVSREFNRLGISHRVFDSREPFASSVISENLFSDSWLKGLPYVRASLKHLFDNYNVLTKRLRTNASVQDVFHVPINDILVNQYTFSKVTKLNEEGLFCRDEFYPGINIVCAGYYTRKLIALRDLDALTGHGMLFEPTEHNAGLPETMRHYRPYVHEKILRWHDGRVWYGDSTTIKHETYLHKQNEYISQTIQRAAKIGLRGNFEMKYGARPFIAGNKKRFGLFAKVANNNYVLTGGWKDGLVIYPYLLNQLKQAINA
jgi:hypothetical protein